MHRLIVALRAFWAVLCDDHTAKEIERALDASSTRNSSIAPQSAKPSTTETPLPESINPSPKRNDAITLLSVLQREARWVDFIHKPITDYSDAQIAAAVRDIHGNCRNVLQGIFGLRPIESGNKGDVIELQDGFDPARIRVTGKSPPQLPLYGKLVHHGWQATRYDLPEWAGSERASNVVAPAEFELQ